MSQILRCTPQYPENFKTKPRLGFTLVEVLVAVFIIAAAMAMAANLLIRSQQTSLRARDLTAATLVARTQMNRLLAMDFDDLLSERIEKQGEDVQGMTSYHWKATVENLDEQRARIHLVVQWYRRGKAIETEFYCIRGKWEKGEWTG